MTVITNTLGLAYPVALYVATLPSGGRLAIEARATFGDLLVFTAALLVVGFQLVQITRGRRK